MTQLSPPNPLVLIVLDGWGIREKSEDNAITQANTPYYDELLKKYPWTTLEASGKAVGLPEGKAGNSETGHMNLGAGFIVKQDVVRISEAIENKEFFSNKILLEASNHIKKHESSLHIMGLLSDANVHSEYTHILALLDFAQQENVENMYLHLFTDGRDSSPTEGKKFVGKLQDHISKTGVGQIASIIGRYYAMDRDNRWDRTQRAYNLLTKGEGVTETDPVQAIQNAYDRGETDEFIKPIILTANSNQLIASNDAVIFFNFRTDRPRQLTHAFVLDDFDDFERAKKIDNLYYATMTEYEEDVSGSGVIFPPLIIDNPFGKIISDAGLTQLHAAETEKVAHVTYFFNGGREEPFPGERRIHIPSDKSVATYDLAPEMKAAEITDAVLKDLVENQPDFILINYANADMVGHSGNMDATITAVETIDAQLARLIPEILDRNGAVIITADHGNAEVMMNKERHEIDTEHNIYPAPFIFISNNAEKKELPTGVLSDVATTMVSLMELNKPEEMTGQDILE